MDPQLERVIKRAQSENPFLKLTSYSRNDKFSFLHRVAFPYIDK